MAVCGVLVVVAVKAILANGFGFQVAPFQMELQIPAGGPEPFQPSPITFGGPSPLMSMMSFPPIFNPMEAMGREEMEGDSRMDVNGPMGNVTTKNKTESKDGFKVTTITSDGPGFHSYIKEYEKEGNSTGNATGPAGPPPDIGKLLSSGKIFDIMNQLRNMGKKPAKCKKCGSGKFCDPIFHLCRKKFAEGRTCMAQKQCGANLRCQWGKCQKAKKGDPGTFCKGNNQCKGDACCRNTPGSFHLMCIPPQTEGAICGLHERQESVAKLFYVVKRSTVATCSPCKSGLKCANTGNREFKQCVRSSYLTKIKDTMGDETPGKESSVKPSQPKGDELDGTSSNGGSTAKIPVSGKEKDRNVGKQPSDAARRPDDAKGNNNGSKQPIPDKDAGVEDSDENDDSGDRDHDDNGDDGDEDDDGRQNDDNDDDGDEENEDRPGDDDHDNGDDDENEDENEEQNDDENEDGSGHEDQGDDEDEEEEDNRQSTNSIAVIPPGPKKKGKGKEKEKGKGSKSTH